MRIKKLSERIKDFYSLSKGNIGGAVETVVSEVIPFIGSARPLMEETDKMRLSHLLVGLKHGNDFDSQIEKLYNYIDKPEKANYVVSMFRESLMSSSHIVNTIMGVQLSKMIGEDSDITQEDFVMYDALTLMYMLNYYMLPDYEQYFKARGYDLNLEQISLSVLIQWIWRSAIRDGKPINLFLPSSRMRRILCKWLGKPTF